MANLQKIEWKYDYLYDFIDGIARVKTRNWDYDFINTDGVQITPKQSYGTLYSDARDFNDGLAAVKNKNSLFQFYSYFYD